MIQMLFTTVPSLSLVSGDYGAVGNTLWPRQGRGSENLRRNNISLLVFRFDLHSATTVCHKIGKPGTLSMVEPHG